MKRLLAAFAMMALAGCGGGGDGESTQQQTVVPPTVNATGFWAGSATSSVFGSQSVTLNLMQSGATITGNYSSTVGAVGTVTGSVSGDTTDFTLTVTTPGCSGSFSGTGTIDTPAVGPSTMAFRVSGSSTCGGNESLTGNLSKQ